MTTISSMLCIEPGEAVYYFTAGKSYPVKTNRENLPLPGVEVIDDEGEPVFVRLENSSHGKFEVVMVSDGMGKPFLDGQGADGGVSQT
ncbi:hypothetical protein AB0001_004757 [Salmonella enterica]|nr:hypothetical protein [Salmonella enterica]EEP3372989.1 hypothetical protein [Salmonella enterica]EFP6579696.1 hypothetical protein [Salmonella enterica]EGC7970978.1 hypothetical protein [Salmonella enterica]EIV4461161.1 hypothetical protein [Salmonella enterica]